MKPIIENNVIKRGVSLIGNNLRSDALELKSYIMNQKMFDGFFVYIQTLAFVTILLTLTAHVSYDIAKWNSNSLFDFYLDALRYGPDLIGLFHVCLLFFGFCWASLFLFGILSNALHLIFVVALAPLFLGLYIAICGIFFISKRNAGITDKNQ